MIIKIKVDREKCIGCGSCVAVCEKNFELKDGKARAKKTEVKEIGCNQEAADVCPVGAITITKK